MERAWSLTTELTILPRQTRTPESDTWGTQGIYIPSFKIKVKESLKNSNWLANMKKLNSTPK